MNLEKARFNMIQQQIRPWDVLDQRVLDAMESLPREEFVPEAYRKLAFADIRIPIGEGQVMLTPKMEARIAQELRLTGTDKVLEVGTGSGFLTALLARLTGHVHSVEIREELSRSAGQRLATHGITNVTLVVGDGCRGWSAKAPYDAIAVTGSVPVLSDELQRQLNVGGRLFAVVGESPVMEALIITRLGERDFATQSIFETDLPPLEGIEKPEEFVL